MSYVVTYNGKDYIPVYREKDYLFEEECIGNITLLVSNKNGVLKNTDVTINDRSYTTNSEGKILFQGQVEEERFFRVVYNNNFAEVSSSFKTYTENIIEVSVTNIMEGTVTWKWTSTTSVKCTLTVPWYANIIRCQFTWAYNSDERSRLGSGISYGVGSGCGIRNAISGVHWINRNSDGYIKVTPGKTYTLNVWVDGYKGRDYGFILSWSTEINSHASNKTDL